MGLVVLQIQISGHILNGQMHPPLQLRPNILDLRWTGLFITAITLLITIPHHESSYLSYQEIIEDQSAKSAICSEIAQSSWKMWTRCLWMTILKSQKSVIEDCPKIWDQTDRLQLWICWLLQEKVNSLEWMKMIFCQVKGEVFPDKIATGIMRCIQTREEYRAI